MNVELELKTLIKELISQYNIKYYAVHRSMYFAGVEVRMYDDNIKWYAEGYFTVEDYLNNKNKIIKDLEDLHKLYLIGPEQAK